MKEKFRNRMLMGLDTVLLIISILFAYVIRFDGDIFEIETRFLETLPFILLINIIVKLIIFFLFKLYTSLWQFAGDREVMYIISASFLGNMIMTGFILLSGLAQQKVPRSIFLIAFFTDCFLVGGIRYLYRIYRRFIIARRFKNKDPIKAVIIGAGEAGAMIIDEMVRHPETGYVPVAVIDDNPSKWNMTIKGIPIVGGRPETVKTVKEYGAKEIIISIPSAPRRVINEILNYTRDAGCRVKILPSVSQLIDGTVSIKKIRDIEMEDLLQREPVKLSIDRILKYINKKTVLITGGGGSIGSELCRQLATFEPDRLIILDNYENNAFLLQNELKYKYPFLNIEVVIANIRDMARLESIFEKYCPHVVFHAAAHKHVVLMEENPSEAVKNNVFGTYNVALCAHKFCAERFVLISTDKAVNPTSIMGATKKMAEMIIEDFSKKSDTIFSAVRFGNVIGSNGSIIPLFRKQIEQGGPVTVRHKEVTRFFMTISEASLLVLEAGAMSKGGEIFVLDMGEPVKIYDLARNLIKLSGFEPDEDIKIEITELAPGEKLHEELMLAEEEVLDTENEQIFMAKSVVFNKDKFKNQLENIKTLLDENEEELVKYIGEVLPNFSHVFCHIVEEA